MKGKLERTILTIKFFLLSMLLLSAVMSTLVFWILYRVIRTLPENNGESLKIEEIQVLSQDVQKIYGECLSKIDWVKVKAESKAKTEECVKVASETESYKRLKSVYDTEVLPIENTP